MGFPLRRLGQVAAALTPFWIVVAVGVRAATVPAEDTPRAPEALRRRAYEFVVRAEPRHRRAAARKFPYDAWSQDDDFHNKELQRARFFARRRDISVAGVLQAIDEGLRGNWPPHLVEPRATVAPCRPRVRY